MDFQTISRLRPVSTHFERHFRKYCLSLRQFDLEIANRGVKELNQYPCYQYMRLLETVAYYCSNLEKVSGVLVRLESVNLVTRSFLETISRLKSVGLEYGNISRLSVFQLLSRLPNVTSVQLYGLLEANGEDIPNEPEQLLDIAELNVENGRFWHLFRVESIRKLAVASETLFPSRDREENSVIATCTNIEELDLKIDVDSELKIVNGVAVVAEAEKLPRLKKLTIGLIGHVDNVQRFADVCSQILRYATSLDTRFPEDNTGKSQLAIFLHLLDVLSDVERIFAILPALKRVSFVVTNQCKPLVHICGIIYR